MRNVLVAVLLLLMAAGCTKPAVPVPPEVESPAPPAPVGQAPELTPDSIEALLPVPAPLPPELQRVSLAAGAPLESPGLYFMDLASGSVDGWLPPLGEHGIPTLSLWSSDDERWVLAGRENEGHLIRRSDGAVFSYDPQQVQLTVGPGVIFARPASWQEGQQTRCALLDADAKLIATLTLNGGCTADRRPLFSPDGKMLALSGSGGLWLVTVATGEIKQLGPWPVPEGKLLMSEETQILRATGELVVMLELADNSHPGRGLENLVRIYAWDGTVRSERRVEGYRPAFSPDGRLLTAYDTRGLGGSMPTLHDWASGQARYRVAGGFGTQWLADSSALLVSTSEGYRLVSATGEMQAVPPVPGRDSYQPFVWLIPSPDNADRFLSMARVIDRGGQVLREVRIADGKDLRVALAYWGPTSGSFHFYVMPPLGKGMEPDLGFWLRPRVQFPPYPEAFQLEVDDPKGECLNLRADAAETSRVVRCLPTGTKLAVEREGQSEPYYRWEGEWVWLPVRTETGESGWVAINTRSVAHAK